VDREQELLTKHQKKWAGTFFALASSFRFHRGFIEAARIFAGPLLKHTKECWLHPLRFLEIRALLGNQVKTLIDMPQLSRLAGLSINSMIRQASFEKLLGCRYLNGLRALSIYGIPIAVAGIKKLVESALLAQLTHLAIGATGCRLEGVEFLSRSKNVQNLTTLDLRGLGLDIKALRAIDRSACLGNLTRLELWYNRLGDPGLEEFVKMPLFARLRHLSMCNNRYTDRALWNLAKSPVLANLRTLCLGVDRFGDEAVRAIIDSPYLQPDATLALWMVENLSESVKDEARKKRGSRVLFDHQSADLWESDPTVGWPLWQPS
jgi:hypothetical protein